MQLLKNERKGQLPPTRGSSGKHPTLPTQGTWVRSLVEEVPHTAWEK